MTLVIATPKQDCAAVRALVMEGLRPIVGVCPRDNDYGELVTAFWNAGEPFVICEWDIVPWPGAVDELLRCPMPRCTHRYPLAPGNVTLGSGLVKYRPKGPAPENWATTPWWALDGQVVPVLNDLFGTPCVHEPPVAHARAETP